jgi:heavy metal sensor kinase
MPLRWRLAVLFATATATVLAVAGILLLQQAQLSLTASVHSRLMAREAVLSRLVTLRGDELRNHRLRQDLLDWPYPPDSEQTAQVFTPDGTLALSIQVAEGRPLLTDAQLEQARRGPIEFRSESDVPGEGHLIRATPVQPPGDGRWVTVVGADLGSADAVVDRIRTGLLVGGPLAIGLSALGAWLLAGAALRPVERLRRQAAALSADDTAVSLEVPPTGDELASLGRTMNDLLHRMQEALERQRRFVADAGHELRTPLTVLRAELELAGRPGRTREELAEAVASAGTEVDRLIRLAEHLLLTARSDQGRPLLSPVPTSLNELLAGAVRAVTARAGPDVEVHLDAPHETTVLADPERLRQAVDNLLDNALRFAPPGSRVEVRLRKEERPDGRRAVIEVADSGPGFPPEFLPRAFERFERADAARTRDGGGSGLGLAIARSLARAHGGDAVAANRPSGGAVVRLELPLAGAPQPAAS